MYSLTLFTCLKQLGGAGTELVSLRYSSQVKEDSGTETREKDIRLSWAELIWAEPRRDEQTCSCWPPPPPSVCKNTTSHTHNSLCSNHSHRKVQQSLKLTVWVAVGDVKQTWLSVARLIPVTAKYATATCTDASPTILTTVITSRKCQH